MKRHASSRPHRHHLTHFLVCVSAAFGIIAFTATNASAQPCTSLEEAEMKQYVDLGKRAVTAYVEQDFARSIELNQQARNICDEDPVVAYNLARAYHNNGDCLQALYLYGELPLGEMSDKTEKVEGYMAELEGQCGESGTVRVTCEDPGVELNLAGRSVSCPWAGRLPAGNTEIVASLGPDYKPYTAAVDVTVGGTADVAVPVLKSKDQFGMLKVTCADGVKSFTLSGPFGDETLECPYEGEVEVGNYFLKTAPNSKAKAVTVVAMQETRVDKLSTSGGGCACDIRREDSELPGSAWLLALGLISFVALRSRQRR